MNKFHCANLTLVVWEIIDDLNHSLLTEVSRYNMVPPSVPSPSHPDVTNLNYFLNATNIVLDWSFVKKCINSFPSGVPVLLIHFAKHVNLAACNFLTNNK